MESLAEEKFLQEAQSAIDKALIRYRRCRKLCSTEDIEDASQEAMIEVWEKRGNIENVQQYAAKRAISRLLDIVRRESTRTEAINSIIKQMGALCTPEEIAEYKANGGVPIYQMKKYATKRRKERYDAIDG